LPMRAPLKLMIGIGNGLRLMETKDVVLEVLDTIFEELPSEQDRRVFSETVNSVALKISALLTIATIDEEGDDRVLH